MKKIKDFIAEHKTISICVVVLLLVVLSVVLFGWIGLWYDALIAIIVGIILTGMKKHGLLKIISIILLLIVLISNILPGRQDAVDRIGLIDPVINYLSIVLQNFSYILLFVLAVGGFYGVLNKTPAYKKLLDNIVTKVKPSSKKFLYAVIIVFAIIASLTGMTIPLLVFVPFIISIILLLGYDKLVALTTTVVSIIVGFIGGVFVNFVNPNTYTITTYEEFVGMESKLANTFPKLLLLFAGIALLIYFVNKYIKNVEEKKVKYELSDSSELLIAEVKGSYKEIKTWPLIIILLCTFIILVLGFMPWNGLFEIDIFTKFHTWLTGLSIGDFKLYASLISSNLPALGEWNSTGNLMASYVYISLLIMFMTLIVVLANRIKVNEAVDSFLEGVKKAIPIAILLTVAYTVLVCSYNNGFIEKVISSTGKFNYGISSLLAFVGCILNVDTIWVNAGIFAPIIELITDESIYASVAVLLQGIYGVFQLVGPTSLILIISLTYLDVPYTTWLKYIWRFVLSLIILVALVTLLVTLL